jgi:exopolysaccharide biosynthesis polyprenyl glycosylphosphotransferase
MSAPDYGVAFDAETMHIVAEDPPASNIRADQNVKYAISPENFRSLFALCEGLAEFSVSTFAVFAAYPLSFLFHPAVQSQFLAHNAMAAGTLVGLFVVLLLQSDKTRRAVGGPLQIRETECAVRVSVLALLALLPAGYFFNFGLSPAIVLLALILTPFLLIVEKHLAVTVLRATYAKGIGADHVVIYATAKVGRRIAMSLRHSPRLGLLPVAVVDDDPSHADGSTDEFASPRHPSFPIHHGPLMAARLQAYGCRLLLIAANQPMEKLASAVRAAKESDVRVALLPALSIASSQQAEWLDLHYSFGASIVDVPRSLLYTWTKRASEVLLSSVLLILLAPLLAAIALLIRVDSPGPALFIQKRVGLRGRLFDIYKFRSMHVGVPSYALSPATSRDRRITRVGRWLRRISLDELPQLFNVLLGDMSLVGPRPEMPFLVEQHRLQHEQRLRVTPGITGLWQLSWARAAQIHENPEFDYYYIQNRTYFLDIAILIHTLVFAVRGV